MAGQIGFIWQGELNKFVLSNEMREATYDVRLCKEFIVFLAQFFELLF